MLVESLLSNQLWNFGGWRYSDDNLVQNGAERVNIALFGDFKIVDLHEILNFLVLWV